MTILKIEREEIGFRASDGYREYIVGHLKARLLGIRIPMFLAKWLIGKNND